MAHFFLLIGKDVRFNNSSFCKTFLKQIQICTGLRQTKSVLCTVLFIFMSLLLSIGFDVDSTVDLNIFGFSERYLQHSNDVLYI